MNAPPQGEKKELRKGGEAREDLQWRKQARQLRRQEVDGQTERPLSDARTRSRGWLVAYLAQACIQTGERRTDVKEGTQTTKGSESVRISRWSGRRGRQSTETRKPHVQVR
ncbi:hypothetical protein MRX96_021596 [Rhipicephalus microplus]